MNQISPTSTDGEFSAVSSIAEGNATILAVGNPEEWRKSGRHLPSDQDITFAAFTEVTASLLHCLCPTVVLSPVLAHQFDCIDLAQRLQAIGFRGEYRAIAADLPDPTMIEREIKHLCPLLNFGVLQSF